MRKDIFRLAVGSAMIVGFSAYHLAAQDVGLDWSTYFGAGKDERGGRVQVDNDGNPLLYGQTYSSSLAHECALDKSSGGDAVWGTINTEGELLSICRISGKTYSEDIVGAAEDSEGNWYFCGGTESASGIATEGAHQTLYAIGKGQKYLSGKGPDGYLAKISVDREVAWGTYYGGKENDNATDVVVDNEDNVYVCGSTNSSTHVATDGAYQSELDPESDDPESGNIWVDGFLAKFTPSGERVWGTYYGGKHNDRINAATADPTKNYIYITGTASSPTGIASADAHKQQSSSTDAFIAKFDTDGNRIWGTYFGGEGRESAADIVVDGEGNVYICGLTTGDDLFGNRTVNESGGDWDGFVAKFSDSGDLMWTRFIGGPKRESAYALAVGNGRVYVTGSTNSSSGIAFEGYMSNRGDEYYVDAFIVALNGDDGELFWGSYFGGEKNDIGYGIAVGKNSEIYLSGTTSSQSNVAHDGFLQSAQGNEDLFLARFTDDSQSRANYKHPKGRTSADIGCKAFRNKLEITFGGNESVVIGMYDANGRELLDREFTSVATARGVVSLPLDRVPSGMYFISLQSGADIYHSRVVVP